MKAKILLFLSLILKLNCTFAEQKDSLNIKNIGTEAAPIPIELFGGDKGFVFQLIVSKQFSAKSRFGFFNVTSFAADYKAIRQSSAFLSQGYLTAQIWRGLSADLGLSAIGSSNTSLTVRPTAGLQYLFANRNFLVLVLPRFDLIQSYNFETFALMEYRPMISKKWGIYSRVQGLFNYNVISRSNEISSVYLRLGVSYKNLQFGIGTNHDFYGKEAQNINNFGLFIKADIF